MKKILTIIGLATVASFAYSQGTLTFENASTPDGNYTNMTPSITVGGPGSIGSGGLGGGLTTGSVTAPKAYYFTLLMASASGASPTDNPLDSGWTQPVLATNTAVSLIGNNFASAGSMAGPNSSQPTEVNGFTAGSSVYIMLVGWSANLGTTWAAVESELQGNWSSLTDSSTVNYFFGYTTIGQITLGSPSPGVPAQIFGGTGLPGGVTMDRIVTPEPTTLALAGLGGLSLLFLRRRKS